MNIDVSLLPSGGYGYGFPSINVNPMVFQDIVDYTTNLPEDDPLGRYFFDVEMLKQDDPKVVDLYVMDIDFLIFYKKLITVSEDLSYQVEIKCPYCGKPIKKTISFERDIHFKQIDPKIMEGAKINLGGHTYETIVPTWNDFIKVFQLYLRIRKVHDLKMIKTISLIKDWDYAKNQIEHDILEATHSDISLLMALRELYFDRVDPITVYCPECNKDLEPGEERRSVAVSVDSLIVDFFRDLYINCPIDGSKILFK
jgi:DNA-directed RNA polymerase subunit RPC12/RpoP